MLIVSSPENSQDSSREGDEERKRTPVSERIRRNQNRNKKKMTEELCKAVLRMTREVTDKLENLNLARPNIPLPIYSGRSNDKSFHSFIREFNRVANASGWDEITSFKVFPSCLKGEASSLFETLTNAEKADWQTMLDSMAKKLAGGADIVAAYRRQVNNVKQKSGESLAEFADIIKETVGKGYPDSAGFSAAMRECISIDIFRAGVNQKIREHLLRRTKPATLAAALSEAISEENIINDLAREIAAVNIINSNNQNSPVDTLITSNYIRTPFAPNYTRPQFYTNNNNLRRNFVNNNRNIRPFFPPRRFFNNNNYSQNRSNSKNFCFLESIECLEPRDIKFI